MSKSEPWPDCFALDEIARVVEGWLSIVFALQSRYRLRSHGNSFLAAQRNALRDRDCDVLMHHSHPPNESDVLPDDLSGFVQVGLYAPSLQAPCRRSPARC